LKNNQNNQTDSLMNIIKRTCATCAAFNPAPEGDDPTCWNLVNIVIHHVDENNNPIVIHRQPYAGFRCDSHMTHEEDRAEDAAIGAFWLTLGIAPRLGLPDGMIGPTDA
jgi:hypothetical protein